MADPLWTFSIGFHPEGGESSGMEAGGRKGHNVFMNVKKWRFEKALNQDQDQVWAIYGLGAINGPLFYPACQSLRHYFHSKILSVFQESF